MNHTLVTYLGFVVAVLIITWAVVEMSSRYRRAHRRQSGQRVTTSSSANRWVTFKPDMTSDDELLPGESVDAEDTLEVPPSDSQSRPKQNGHYSQSKHPL